jgi:hypothetical protein
VPSPTDQPAVDALDVGHRASADGHTNRRGRARGAVAVASAIVIPIAGFTGWSLLVPARARPPAVSSDEDVLLAGGGRGVQLLPRGCQTSDAFAQQLRWRPRAQANVGEELLPGRGRAARRDRHAASER